MSMQSLGSHGYAFALMDGWRLFVYRTVTVTVALSTNSRQFDAGCNDASFMNEEYEQWAKKVREKSLTIRTSDVFCCMSIIKI